MTAKIFWRLFVSVLFLGYALISMLPLKSTPFREYVEEHVTANQEEFKTILAEADERVAAYRDESVPADKKSPTAYAAIKDIASGKGKSGTPFALAQFFPDIRMVREPVLEKQNNILMQELLRRSQGKMKLGLDLQGGISFTLRVNPESAEADKKALAAAKTPEERARVEEDIRARAEEKLSQLNQATAVMEDRVNQFGVSEPVIRPVGNDSIEIQLPGEDTANNPEAINSLKKPARLEFRMVHRYLFPEAGTPEGTIKSLRENPSLATSPVAAYEVLYDYHIDKTTGESVGTPIYVKKAPEATGAIVSKAVVESPDGLTLQVGISFTSAGGRIFGDVTQRIADEDNRTGGNGRFAIVLDGKLMSAPTLNAENGGRKVGLYGGRASITGNFDRKEAEELANALNNPLEFPLELQDMTNVGASLAKDAQSQSMMAAAVATALIILFLVVFYLAAGVVAIIGIFANMFMIFGVMCAIGATITLPGIAALVLTLGMAVDANILVFERIREELAAGKSLKTALSLGYSRAFVTIFDSQLTSLITAGILIWMGTGSVKGFGVTLAIGIITTLFTCIVTCRGLQELLVNLGWTHRFFGLSFMKKKPAFRFMAHWRVAMIFSGILIFSSIAFPIYKGSDCLSKDFKGGESVTLRIVQDASKQVSVGEIKKIAEEIGIADASAVYQQKVGASEQTLNIECALTEDTTQGEFSNIEKLAGAILEKCPQLFPDDAKSVDDIVVGKQAVGATVSAQLVKMAVISLALAVLGIMVYVALRFEVGFGVGAMLSTVHDIVVVTGLYLICGGQFSASMIAAILMVAGYSINDTIVVFDRIREELGNHPQMKLGDVIDLSINNTLSRTLLTSVTVLMSAISLAVFGAGDVAEYGKIFIWGVLVGTFSSIYIASPIFYWWHKGDRRKVEEGDKAYTYSWEAGAEKK